jgi:hypothetical protein
VSQLSNTIELFEQTREGSADVRSGTMTRRFLVPASRETALAYPGVPTYGSNSVFTGRTLRCDRLDCAGTPDPTITEVTASYSSDGRFSIPPRIDRTENNFARWSLSTTLQTRKVPSFVLRTVFDGTNPPVQVWERDDWQIEVPITTFSSTVVLSEYSNETMNTILVQVGRIHQFGSFTVNATDPYAAFWRFKGHTASRIADDRFEVSYSWYADHGNAGFYTDSGPVSPPPDGEIGLIGSHRLICTTGRNQFEEYLIVPPQNEGETPGIITYQPFQTFIDDGDILNSWKLLPGNPIEGNP